MAGDDLAPEAVRDIPTLEDLRGPGQGRRERLRRRTGLGVLACVVAAALVGLLGGRQATVASDDGPVTVVVQYPQITRPGIEAPLQVRAHREGGFDGPVRLAFDAELFERLDFNAWYPTPSAETADGRFVLYEFDEPAGETFTARLDAHAQSTQGPSNRTYVVGLLDPDLRIDLRFRMWVLP